MKTRSAFFALILCAVLVAPSFANAVTQNDRVETRLRVREQANGSSTVVGFLAVGESPPLTRDVLHWFVVTLPDGTPGFVSKGFARVIPGSVG